jgi:hypothetical protein
MPPEFVPEVEWAETEADDTDANDDDEAAAAAADDDELAAIEELTESRMVVWTAVNVAWGISEPSSPSPLGVRTQ